MKVCMYIINILVERVNVGEYSMYKFSNCNCIKLFVNALEKIKKINA